MVLTPILDFVTAFKTFSTACFSGDRSGGGIDDRSGVCILVLAEEAGRDP